MDACKMILCAVMHLFALVGRCVPRDLEAWQAARHRVLQSGEQWNKAVAERITLRMRIEI
jgi:hypothetical protein